jgi:hypothetical protein
MLKATDGIVILTAIVFACCGSSCSKSSVGEDAKSAATKPAASEPASKPASAPTEAFHLTFRSATYRLTSQNKAKVTVRLAASLSPATSEDLLITTGYVPSVHLQWPLAYQVDGTKALMKALMAPDVHVADKDVHLYVLTNEAKEASVTLPYEFVVQTEDIKSMRPIRFRLRYAYHWEPHRVPTVQPKVFALINWCAAIESNWVDCVAVCDK